jgi:hypothetical protein
VIRNAIDVVRTVWNLPSILHMQAQVDELPEEWRTAEIRTTFVKVVGQVELPRGRAALGVMVLLKDGTNVFALTWDKGTRLARVCPDTDWALEERFTGRPPGPGEGVILKLWKLGIDSMIRAGHEVKEEMAQPGWRPPPAQFVMTSPEALAIAYQTYCANPTAPPMTREEFERGVELLACEEALEERRGS